MNTLLNINDRVLYTKNGKDWTGTIVKVHEDNIYRVQFDDPEFDGWSGDGLDNLWNITKYDSDLKPLVNRDCNFYIVPEAELKRIYDVACDTWKQKIADMIKPFADHAVVTNEMAEAMLKAATPSQRPVVEDVLKNAGYKFEAKAEYFEFDHGDNVINTYSRGRVPLMVMNGLAKTGFAFKELGFIGSSDWTPVLVREDGTEEVISGCRLRFKVIKTGNIF
jgi:hypothetical protein